MTAVAVDMILKLVNALGKCALKPDSLAISAKDSTNGSKSPWELEIVEGFVVRPGSSTPRYPSL